MLLPENISFLSFQSYAFSAVLIFSLTNFSQWSLVACAFYFCGCLCCCCDQCHKTWLVGNLGAPFSIFAAGYACTWSGSHFPARVTGEGAVTPRGHHLHHLHHLSPIGNHLAAGSYCRSRCLWSSSSVWFKDTGKEPHSTTLPGLNLTLYPVPPPMTCHLYSVLPRRLVCESISVGR